MKKQIKEIDVKVLDIQEHGLDVVTQLDAEPIDDTAILIMTHVSIGNQSKENYRYHIDLTMELYNVYEGQDFQTEQEILKFIQKVVDKELIQLIKFYDRLLIDKNYNN